jgi:hypothetical protein
MSFRPVDGALDGLARDLDRVLAVATIDLHADLVAEGLELVGSGGAMHVARGEQRAVALSLQQIGELCRGGRLAGALQAHEHDHVRGAVLREDELRLGRAQELRQLVEHDAHDVLRGRERVEHLGGHALLLAFRHELLHDAVVHVRLEKGHANLAHGGVDVVLRQAPLAAELAERVLKSVGKAVEHEVYSPSPSPTRARAKSMASKV